MLKSYTTEALMHPCSHIYIHSRSAWEIFLAMITQVFPSVKWFEL